MFNDMLNMLRERVTQVLAHVELEVATDEALFQQSPQQVTETRQDPAFAGEAAYAGGAEEDGEEAFALAPVMRRQAAETVNPDDPATWGRVSRNAACPCNSGRKYKHCHGKVV